jgi:hypothetical protein
MGMSEPTTGTNASPAVSVSLSLADERRLSLISISQGEK